MFKRYPVTYGVKVITTGLYSASTAFSKKEEGVTNMYLDFRVGTHLCVEFIDGGVRCGRVETMNFVT